MMDLFSMILMTLLFVLIDDYGTCGDFVVSVWMHWSCLNFLSFLQPRSWICGLVFGYLGHIFYLGSIFYMKMTETKAQKQATGNNNAEQRQDSKRQHSKG